jgi:hypothetical protein
MSWGEAVGHLVPKAKLIDRREVTDLSRGYVEQRTPCIEKAARHCTHDESNSVIGRDLS